MAFGMKGRAGPRARRGRRRGGGGEVCRRGSKGKEIRSPFEASHLLVAMDAPSVLNAAAKADPFGGSAVCVALAKEIVACVIQVQANKCALAQRVVAVMEAIDAAGGGRDCVDVGHDAPHGGAAAGQ